MGRGDLVEEATVPNAIAGLLRERAGRRPDEAVLLAARGGRSVTARNLCDEASAMRRLLSDAGVPAGGHVGLRGREPVALATAWLAVIASGRCVAPIAPDADGDAVRRWRDSVRPWLVLDADAGLVWAGAAEPGGLPDPGEPATSAAGLVLASSGTTGTPKLVALPVAKLLATARNVVAAHELTPADRCYNPLPLWHINAEVVALLASLVSGGSVVLDDRFHSSDFWARVQQSRATWVNAVPAILAILRHDTPPAGATGRIRFARSASAALLPTVQADFEAATGVPVVQTYGMTEAASQITAQPLPSKGFRSQAGSVGRPVGVELRIADGRVQIRGDGVITEYASAAGADRITADGWVDTGDVGWLDDAGELHLDGRADDIINRGGEKLSPAHIEDALVDTAGVEAIVVVGAPDAVLGQVPVAAVLASGAGGAEVVQRVQACATARLERVRRPARIHVVDDLGAGVNGKISRRRVLERLQSLGLEQTCPTGTRLEQTGRDAVDAGG